jgi:hypothetical protein
LTAAAVIDFNKRTHREQVASDAINDIVAKGLAAKRALQPRRDYLGASAIGAECARQLQFDLAQAPREKEPGPETLRKFDLGHMGEEAARFWFIDAGFDLVTKSPRTKAPYRFTQLDGRFAGTPDGVFIGGPKVDGVGYPCLWETKSTGGKTYREIEKHGLKKARPGYYTQVAVYQAYLQLTEHPAIFTVNNLDTGEQLHLLVPFDAEEAQRATDLAVQVIKATDAGELLPRPFADESDFRCKFCAFAKRCWSLPQ